MCSSFSFLPSFRTVYSFVYPLLFTFSRNVLVSTIMRQWYILDIYACGRPQSGVVSPIGTYQDNATSHTLVQSVYSCTQTLIYYSFKFAFEVTPRWLCAGTNHKSDISTNTVTLHSVMALENFETVTGNKAERPLSVVKSHFHQFRWSLRSFVYERVYFRLGCFLFSLWIISSWFNTKDEYKCTRRSKKKWKITVRWQQEWKLVGDLWIPNRVE